MLNYFHTTRPPFLVDPSLGTFFENKDPFLSTKNTQEFDNEFIPNNNHPNSFESSLTVCRRLLTNSVAISSC